MTLSRDAQKRRAALWAVRRRWVWPGYSIAIAGVGVSALLDSTRMVVFCLGVLFVFCAIDLSVSARIYQFREDRVGAAIVWFCVGVAGLSALLAWLVAAGWVRS